MMALFSILSILLTKASYEQFEFGIKISWSFPSDEDVDFTLEIPDDYLQDFDWCGFGVKIPSDWPEAMKDSDIVAIHISDDRLEDRYAVKNGEPQIDIEEGGTDDITYIEKINEEEETSFTWTRKLVTGDTAKDNELIYGEIYELQWACGDYMEDGSLAPHTQTDRGKEEVELCSDYENDEYDIDDGTLSFLLLKNT